MKTVLHKSNTRGFANHGWLKSYQTFSFAGYQNPQRMNFGALRVFNDDLVQPDMGFGSHPHQNMEIISIPLKGALSHKDSLGNKRAIDVGEVQVMSAGTGLSHSEFNDSKTDAVNFLQLWIIPEKMNVTPNYEQRKFDKAGRANRLQTIVAPKDKLEGDALPINQQAYIYRTELVMDHTISIKPRRQQNGLYIFVLDGTIELAENKLDSRDALGVWETEEIKIKAISNSQLICVEVPMD